MEPEQSRPLPKLADWKKENESGAIALGSIGGGSSRAFTIDQVRGLVEIAERLENLLGEERKEVQRHSEIAHIRHMDLGRANKERDEALEQFADLKERLHRAEISLAEQSGYRNRVAEDDMARDGFFVIEGKDGERTVSPKRPPPMLEVRHEEPMSNRVERLMMRGERPKPLHWVNYGGR